MWIIIVFENKNIYCRQNFVTLIVNLYKQAYFKKVVFGFLTEISKNNF